VKNCRLSGIGIFQHTLTLVRIEVKREQNTGGRNEGWKKGKGKNER
jgi:hypothetical protein